MGMVALGGFLGAILGGSIGAVLTVFLGNEDGLWVFVMGGLTGGAMLSYIMSACPT